VVTALPIGLQRRYRHLRRYRRIAEVLLRHGFGYIVESMELQHLVPLRRRIQGEEPEHRPRGARLRAALEELGPTFIKLGQMLSARPDILPADVVAELARLQDRVPPVPFEKIAGEIERELGKPLSALFRSVDPEPIGAASIGQVHRAVLADGAEVVVKVRRPGIEDIVEVDLDILAALAQRADERWPAARVSFVEVVNEFARTLRREMDYRLEAAYTQRFRRLLADDPRVVIPQVYEQLTTSRVLVMEHVGGVKITDRDGLARLGVDPAAVAKLGAETFLKMVFLHGLFHGDPHPGNLFVLPGGRLGVIDFGIVGRLDEETLDAVADLFIGATQRDVARIIDGLLRLDAVGEDAGLGALARDLSDMLDRYHGKTLKELAVGLIVNEVIQLVHDHQLRLPADLLVLGKALVTIEGLGKQLDPDFNALEVARPFAAELLRRRVHPAALARRGTRDAVELAKTLRGLPGQLERAIQRVNRGDVRMRVAVEGLERAVKRLERGYNRIAMAVVFAALFLGSIVLLNIAPGPTLYGVPVLALIVFAAAFGTGLWLALVVIRSGPW